MFIGGNSKGFPDRLKPHSDLVIPRDFDKKASNFKDLLNCGVLSFSYKVSSEIIHFMILIPNSQGK